THLPWDTREAFEERLHGLLTARGVDLVCLAGFMRVLSPAFVDRWHGRLLNVHPSLLPKHRGLHAQRQALEEGVRESGCSVHFVDAGVDTGKVIVQRRVPVLPGDDEEALAARIRTEEHVAYPEAVRRVLRGAVTPGRCSSSGRAGASTPCAGPSTARRRSTTCSWCPARTAVTTPRA